VAANDWLAVNQFSVQGPKLTRRPDVLLFVNGLPLVSVELKNPGDEDADIWAAWNQLQTYPAGHPRPVPRQRAARSSATASRRAWARSPATASASWPGAPSTACHRPAGRMRELETLVLGLCQREC
jgi:type I restriction enzyme R subunit